MEDPGESPGEDESREGVWRIQTETVPYFDDGSTQEGDLNSGTSRPSFKSSRSTELRVVFHSWSLLPKLVWVEKSHLNPYFVQRRTNSTYWSHNILVGIRSVHTCDSRRPGWTGRSPTRGWGAELLTRRGGLTGVNLECEGKDPERDPRTPNEQKTSRQEEGSHVSRWSYVRGLSIGPSEKYL